MGKRPSQLAMKNLHSPNPLSQKSENELAKERQKESITGAYLNPPSQPCQKNRTRLFTTTPRLEKTQAKSPVRIIAPAKQMDNIVVNRPKTFIQPDPNKIGNSLSSTQVTRVLKMVRQDLYKSPPIKENICRKK